MPRGRAGDAGGSLPGGNLIRSDIAETLRALCDQAPDEEIRMTAQATEQDEKYRKKYAKFWR